MIDLIYQEYNTQEWISIIVLVSVFFIQVYFVLRYFLKTVFLKPEPESILENHISVVVEVRNEEEKISQIIEELLSQQFSNFELIIVDDHSMDRTFDLLFSLTNKYKKVKYTGIPQDVRFSEKMNINLGMKAASGAWIVFTNADIVDRPVDWLKKLNGYISDEVDAIVTYSNVSSGKGSGHLLYRIEKMWQYLQSVSFILGGKTFIADQDNVLMRKKIYFDNGGFRSHINKRYANLELILNEKLNKKRIKIATSETSLKSEVDEFSILSYKDLVKKTMQIRHNLQSSLRFELFVDEFSRIVLIAATIFIAIIRPLYWEFLMIIPFIYFILLIVILLINQKRLKERKLFFPSFVYFLVRPLIVLVFGTIMIKDGKNRWI